MADQTGRFARDGVDQDFPYLVVEFDSTTLPSGILGLKDVADFVSALQLFMVRQTIVHPRHDQSAISTHQPMFQALLVVPTTGSVIAEIVPLIATLPNLYANVQPTLIAIQHDVTVLGEVLLWAGKQIGTGAIGQVGASAVLTSIRKRKAQKDRPSQHQLGQPASRVPSSPTSDTTGAPTSDTAYALLRDVARSLETTTNALAAITHDQLELANPILEDSPARHAIKRMNDVSGRPDLQDGAINISIPTSVLDRYDINVSAVARFDHVSRMRINSRLSGTTRHLEPVRISTGEFEIVAGTVVEQPNFHGRTFKLSHSLYPQLTCHWETGMETLVSQQVVPGRQVLVSGFLRRRSRGRPATLHITNIRPVT